MSTKVVQIHNSITLKKKICNKSFKIFTQYLIYILYLLQNEPIKLGPEKYACPYCSRVMKRRAQVKDHIYVHTGERPHICGHCGRAFTQKNNLNKHIREVHKAIPELNMTTHS